MEQYILEKILCKQQTVQEVILAFLNSTRRTPKYKQKDIREFKLYLQNVNTRMLPQSLRGVTA